MKTKFNEFLNENVNTIFYHGSTNTELSGKNGIHIGTKLAATEALEARIGVPAVGEWDGTRIYKDTLLAGKKTLKKVNKETGFNCDSDVPEEDYYPTDRKKKATYSDNSEISMNCKPIVFPVKIIGKMTNTIYTPMSDTRANVSIRRFLKSGNAKSGYFYINDGEDYGSISAVVPNASFLKMI